MKSGAIYICFILLLSVSKIFSQDDGYQKYLQEEKKKYEQYVKEEDQKFINYLKEEWRKYQLYKGIKPDEKPKIPDVPVYTIPEGTKPEPKKPVEIKVPEKPANEPEPEEIPENNVPDEPPVVKEPDSPEPETRPSEDQPPVPERKPVREEDKPAPDNPPAPPADPAPDVEPVIREYDNTDQIDFDFYGLKQNYHYDKGMKIQFSGEVNNTSISEYWEKMARTNYSELVKECLEYKKDKGLNDWGYLLHLKGISEKIYPASRTNQYLLTWFLANQSGYKTRIGYTSEKVYLLVPTKNVIYDVIYLNSGDEGVKSFVIDFENLYSEKSGGFYSYKKDFPQAKKYISMDITRRPEFSNTARERNLRFSYEGKNYNLKVKYNQNLVSFYEYYPYTEHTIYFNAEVSSVTEKSLIPALKKIVAGKSKPEAANILIRFVQTAFDYQTDQQQFDREKPLFVEEIIRYPYSDCEDRSIFYAYLVKKILGLDVIGLNYPGHMATAVKFDVNVPGDYINYQGKKFTVCDPTYINAYIGMAMPQFKNSKLENIIEIKEN